MNDMTSLVHVEDAGLSHDGGENFIFRHVDLSIRQGEFVAVLGPSGVGKSTLLRVIMGLVPPTEGQIALTTTTEHKGNRQAALVFQDARLMPWRTVRTNVELGLEGLGLSRAERHDRAAQALQLVGLSAEADRWPRQLSGGQRQRVGVARALTVNPDLLLMDEPFGALDAITRSSLQTELLGIWEKTRKTVLFVTHDIDEALLLADRVIVLAGKPARVQGDLQVGKRPRDPSTPALRALAGRLRSLIAGEDDPGDSAYWQAAEI
ncbi:ABC transporter ATP-binding protein [Acetobacter conturbans]|uniref:ATP-binding cassette domain-containing protein n=1 Tax=Acetobacter conturbans TaxID=1737472 RepID=A0ABX0K121_9PROT|nr:ABC transporter ATP-binding protein [Acetobacter conturbans]NHN87727.1 ATP-binding cassette domain-containing protein [Acetobacter conturbans]